MTTRGSQKKLSSHTDALLRICFTAAGLAEYATTVTTAQGNFKPKLYKNVYNDSATDWKVWHFVGELPLSENDQHGQPLVATRKPVAIEEAVGVGRRLAAPVELLREVKGESSREDGKHRKTAEN